MPTANYDSSYITFRKQAKALYAFNTQNAAAVAVGGSVRREQPTQQMSDVIVTRKQGGCFCSPNVREFSPSGPCCGGRG
jgi:hypothetical protein